MPELYDELGVSTLANEETLKKAYIQKAKFVQITF